MSTSLELQLQNLSAPTHTKMLTKMNPNSMKGALEFRSYYDKAIKKEIYKNYQDETPDQVALTTLKFLA